MSVYGGQIGKKFHEDGTARRYPGNTVIADVVPGISAYDVMTHLRRMAIEAGFGGDMILLPEDSYHMTVLRGLNDLVRTDGFWPSALDRNAPMTAVDDYVSAAVAGAGLPGPISMRFDGVIVGNEDFRVRVVPANDEQERTLRAFRDRAADAIGLRLPGHDVYTYHITLAYMRFVPQGERAEALSALVGEMEAYLRAQPPFTMTAPYMAYYDDMLAFYSQRIAR